MKDEVASLIETLRSEPLVDAGGLLKPGGRRELEATLQALAARGLRARIVVTPMNADLAPYHGVWDGLALDPRKDLVLLYNGRRWEARGWGLAPSAVDAALASAAPALRSYHARGLSEALLALARASSGVTAPKATSGAWGGVAIGVGTLAGLGLLGFVIARRRRRALERKRALERAVHEAEQIYADVMLASEELPEAEAGVLRDKASRLKGELDGVVSGQRALPAMEETLTLGRIGQLENELEALRSVVLQNKRRS